MTALRNNNESELINMKQDEIDMATRNAYFYAMGMSLATLSLAVVHSWNFYLSHKIGMICRIILTGAIYTKVRGLI